MDFLVVSSANFVEWYLFEFDLRGKIIRTLVANSQVTCAAAHSAGNLNTEAQRTQRGLVALSE